MQNDVEVIIKKKEKKAKLAKRLVTGILGLTIAGSVIGYDYHRSNPTKYSAEEINKELSRVVSYEDGRIYNNLQTLLDTLPKGYKIYTSYVGTNYITEDGYKIEHPDPIKMIKSSNKVILKVNKETSKKIKESIGEVAKILNEINQNMFTGMPKVVVTYGEWIDHKKLDIYSPVQNGNYVIEICTEDIENSRKSFLIGSTKAYAYPTCGLVVLDNKYFNDIYAKNIKSLLMHELMHAMYDLMDTYYNDPLNTKIPSIMGGNASAVALDLPNINDVCLIASKCWDYSPTDEQKQHIKEYLTNKYDLNYDGYNFLTYLKDKFRPLENLFK